jgi:hypothetical protein
VAIYRVGPSGATVVGSDGRPRDRLAPGDVVVPGVIESAEQFRDYVATMPIGAPAPEGAGAQRYRDKLIRPDRGPTA